MQRLVTTAGNDNLFAKRLRPI